MMVVSLAVVWPSGVSIAQQPASGSSESPATVPIVITKDLVYAVRPAQPEQPEKQFTLDVYAPTEAGKWPVVVFLPGRGMGKGTGSRLLLRPLAEQGMVVVSINYSSLYPGEAIHDPRREVREMAETVACAIRFAHKTTVDSGHQATQVILLGTSLGGGLAAHVALVADEIDHQWERFASQQGGPPRQVQCEVPEGSVHVDALVGIAGAYDGFVGSEGRYGREWLQAKDPALWDLLYSAVGNNPELKVRLLHGERDTTIPLENSLAFEAVLLEAGYDVEVMSYDDGHGAPPDITFKAIWDVIRDDPGHEPDR
jgi:acetyl esterase/lipase